MKNKDEKKEMETCVLCNKVTEVPKDLHIDFRDYYIEGVGQLCQDCYFDLYENRAKTH